MSGIGSLLLKLRGLDDPTGALIGTLLGGGSAGTAAPGATPSVRTPGAQPGLPGATGPATPQQPARSAVYDSPPDLLSMYSQLSDYQSRQRRIDSGLSLLAGGLVHPENKGLVAQAFGNDTSAADPLSLIMQLSQFKDQQDAKRKAAAQLQQQQALIPSIAEKYGISPETAQMLAANGELDQFVLDREKGHVPPEAIQGYNLAVEQGYKGGWMQYQEDLKKAGANSTSVTVNNGGANQLLEGLNKNMLDSVASQGDKADAIQSVQNSTRIASQPGGVITGSIASPATLEGRKLWAQMFNLPDKAAENTDELLTQLKNEVLPNIAKLYPASDSDLKYVNEMFGAAQNLTQGSLLRVLDIYQKGLHNKMVKADKGMQQRIDAETDPTIKKQLQTAYAGQKVDIPAYDEGYISRIDAGDIQMLQKDPSPENIKYFDAIYGLGAAEQILNG